MTMKDQREGCCEWRGKKNAKGYGIVLINGKQFFAHRLAVALSGRDIPSNKVCDHLCRNTSCINPEHIELVSIRENTMRGMSIAAQYARRGTCSKGHRYTPANTRLQKDKRGAVARHCRRCYADREYARSRRIGRIKGTHNQPRFVYGAK